MLSEEAFQCLLLSAGKSQHCNHRFSLAHVSVRLHSASDELADLLYRPFSHLPRLQPGTGDAKFDIEILTGVPRPRFDELGDAAQFRRDVGRHRIHASADGRFICQEVLDSDSLWCLDRHANRIIGWVASADRLTLYERGKPLANLLPFVVEPFGRFMFHAALVSWRNRGVLFVGAGGAGKSTSALCCLRGGFDFVGEDLVILEDSAAGFIGHGIYNSAWIAPDHLARFDGMEAYARRGGEVEQRKSMLMLADVLPDRLQSSAPLHFLMLPRVRPDAPCSIERVGKPEAVRQLAPNCLMTASRINKAGFENLVRLVKSTECYRLNLGDDLDRVPELVKAVVEARDEVIECLK